MSPKCLRILFALMFLACVILLSVGFYLEYVEHVLPCPLCVLQRFAYGAVGVIALIACLHPFRAWGGRVYAVFCMLFSLLGTALALRQVWLQLSPANPNAVCVPGLNYLFNTLPFTKAVMTALEGTADCALVHWRFLSFTMAEWSLACFVALTIYAVVLLVRSRACSQ